MKIQGTAILVGWNLILGKILCKASWHFYLPEDSDFAEDGYIYYRTYLRCQRCGQYGKNTWFKKVKSE